MGYLHLILMGDLYSVLQKEGENSPTTPCWDIPKEEIPPYPKFGHQYKVKKNEMLQWPAWFHHYFNITKKQRSNTAVSE